ncbi:MAG: phosphonate C-P lyase system protein PhnL [Opitutales bacterium]
MTPILEVNNLRKSFLLYILNDKKIEALDDVTFSQNEGEIVGLTGKSGSGKSSLMKCIYRTYLCNSGEMIYQSEIYGSIDLLKATEHQILRIRQEEMTYCSQFLSVIPRVPAVEVVAARLLQEGVAYDEAMERARTMLDKLGLPRELWDAFPSTFSGGEQQRINVARAILGKPRYLLIDEPTASLDPKTKDVVIDMILGLKDAGTSVMLITHDKYALERMSDRRLHLAHGRLEEVEVASTLAL